jgi:hypothetical protein
LTDAPDDADVVLVTQCHLVDWQLRLIRGHPTTRRYWHKVMVYDDRDVPWQSFPGVYVSMPAPSFDPGAQRAWCYVMRNEPLIPQNEPDLLFSFIGAPTAPCREGLYRLKHPKAIIERSAAHALWDTGAPNFEYWRSRYLDVLGRSQFVLCPRGRGTSSFRLYEALAAGRVPVILSDDWVAPEGPDWDACSIRWPENNLDGLIPFLVESGENWPRMSAAAAAVHDTYFSTNVGFHRIVEQLEGLVAAGVTTPSPRHMQVRAASAAIRNRAARLSGRRG